CWPPVGPLLSAPLAQPVGLWPPRMPFHRRYRYKDHALMDDRRHPLRDSQEDRETARQVPDTPQTRSPSYRLAFADADFMTREDLRPVRLQLELLKTELAMDAHGI